MKTPFRTFLILLFLAILLFLLQKVLLDRVRQTLRSQVPLQVRFHLTEEAFRLEESLRTFERTSRWLAELDSTRRLASRLTSFPTDREATGTVGSSLKAEALQDLAAAMTRPAGDEEPGWFEIALLATDGQTLLRVGSGGAVLPLASAPFDPIKAELGLASLTVGTPLRSPVLLIPVPAAPENTAPVDGTQMGPEDAPIASGDSPDAAQEGSADPLYPDSPTERRGQYFGYPIASGNTIIGLLLLGADLEATLSPVPPSMETLGGMTSLVTWAPWQCGFYLAHPNPDFILRPEANIFLNIEGPVSLQGEAEKFYQSGTVVDRFLPGKNPTHFVTAVPLHGCPWSLVTVVSLRSYLAVSEKVLDFALKLTIAGLVAMIALGMAAFAVNADPAKGNQPHE